MGVLVRLGTIRSDWAGSGSYWDVEFGFGLIWLIDDRRVGYTLRRSSKINSSVDDCVCNVIPICLASCFGSSKCTYTHINAEHACPHKCLHSYLS